MNQEVTPLKQNGKEEKWRVGERCGTRLLGVYLFCICIVLYLYSLTFEFYKCLNQIKEKQMLQLKIK